MRAGFAASSPALVGLLLLLLVVAFIALMRACAGMALGAQPDASGNTVAYDERAGRLLAAVPLVAGLAGLLVLGVWIPGGLNTLIMHAIGAIT